ncbi:MAG: Trk system potassium transporter TrkA [Eubacterium sp.]
MFGKKKAKGLNIIIVGCGRVGTTLVERLSAEGHDITIIDKKADALTELTNLYDVMGVVGNGASFTVQKEAGITEANLMVAVTESDELNLLCCAVASKVADCATIARVRNPDYGLEIEHLRDKLGLEMIINPELVASREMARILSLPNALEVNSFAHTRAELIKFRIPQGNMLDGMTVANLGAKIDNALICAVERKKQITIPSGDFEFKAGDIVSFVTPRKKARDFFKTIGYKTDQVKNVMIVGGGDSAYYLAKQLLHNGIEVKIIEKNRLRCEKLVNLLPKAVIINGNGSNEELLREEGLSSTEAFVPLTGSDEENILLTLYANQVSPNTKVITKINRITFNDVIDGLDLGSVIYPRYITSEEIIAFVRAKSASRGSNIESLYHMFDQRVEAIEFRVDEESKVTNVPLMKLNLKKDLLVSCIYRRGKIIIPTGQDCIMPGDSVMIVTTHTGFADISDILN